MQHRITANDPVHFALISEAIAQKRLEVEVTDHTFHINEAYAQIIHDNAKDRIAAYHNWTASAVEKGDLEYAQKLVAEMRLQQDIFAAFNVVAWHQIADGTGKPLETEHSVVSRRR